MSEEKTSPRSKKGSGSTGLFLEIIFQSIRSFVDGTLESVHQAIHRFARNLMRRTAAFFIFLAGFIFISVGFAKLLDAVYLIPGAGEMMIGVFMLLLASVLYAFSREE